MRSKTKGVEAVSRRTHAPAEVVEERPVDSTECSLALADVLEDEFREISGDDPVSAPPWEFHATQILKAEELRTRLIEGRDRAARGLAERELQPLVAELVEKGTPKGADDLAALAVALANGFNELLDREDLYQDGTHGSPADSGIRLNTAARFAGVPFRSQTREHIITGPVRQRNRLILEDAFPEIQSRDDARLARVFARAHERKFAALCLSGGGIRSASFALGVVQGLARLGLLERFQYLSTVSGGGYVGAWLSAWMHRAGRDRVNAALTERTGRPLAPEPAPVFHFRNYSSYLSPRIGLTSTDTWTLAAIYLRNLFLNWLVLVPLLATALVLPQLLVALTRLPRAEGDPSVFADTAFIVLLLLSLVFAIVAVRYVHANRPIQAANDSGAVDDPKGGHRAFVRWCFLPMLGAATVLTVIWAWVASGKVSFLAPTGHPRDWHLTLLLGEWSVALHSAWAWAGVGAFVHLGGWLLAGRRRSWHEFLFILITGAFGGLAAGAIAHGLAPSAPRQTPERLEQYAWYVSFAAPALLAMFLVFGHIYVGATSRAQAEATFEWSARYSAWLQIAIAAWLVACGVVLLVPLGLAWALSFAADAGPLIESAKVIASVLGVGAGTLTLLSAYTGRSSAGSPGAGKAGLRARIVQALAQPIFVIVLLAALSYLVGRLMDVPELLSPFFADDSCTVPDPTSSGRHYFHHYALSIVVCGSVPSVLVVLAVLAGGGLLLSLLIDTNRFSLHGMYHARLVRTFLGASRNEQERDPNRFTGFDEHDDIALADLWRRDRPAPFHVVNTALNLVMRDEFASQQRKAISMTFSPLHSGASRLGYRPTREYGGGVTLGTAITISGAAASPEMGYHSKPLLAFLLTLFNIRLGWWLGNPGYAGRHNFRDAAPASSVLPIIDEALGRTDDRNPYVYLSDGGHFENLGLYEMVLRRCHWIVVSDAGCDPRAAYEDLGNAMRRIRVDFGIPIVFANVPIYNREDPRKPDATYCAVGRIRYSAVDGNVEDGTLIYLKPAFYGTEPPDIFNYARTCPLFPHESTANQFFSEAQFESYRRLGSYIVQQVARGEPATGKQERPLALDAFAARVDALLRANGAQQDGGRGAP